MTDTELIANSPTPGSVVAIATLAVAVSTTPAPGTVETWTFSSAPPAALQTASGQYRFTVDSEICIDVTGGAGTARQIQRGAEGSTVATHLQGSGIFHGITAGGLAAWLGTNPSNLPGSVVNVSRAITPSGGDDTAKWAAALASFPTRTVFAIPATNGGASATYPVGTIYLNPGDHNIGASGDIGNIGPFVNVIGAGTNTTRVFYHGSGDAIRMFNAVKPSDNGFDNIAAWHGVIDSFILDGSHAQPGARGLHYGDTEGGVLGPNLMIQNFVGGQMLPTTLTLGATSGSGGGGAFSGGGTFWWRVTATNAWGETMTSNEVTATLAANGSQALSWTAVTNATGYNVYRGTSSGSEVLVASLGNVTSYTDVGAAAGAQSYPRVNVNGSVGLMIDNSVAWTENCWGRVQIYNCDNAVVFTITGPDHSWEYNDFTFKVYCFPNQNGVVLGAGGGAYANGSLKVRSNFFSNNVQGANALLTIYGGSSISRCHLELQGESNALAGSTFWPTTILTDPSNPANNCTNNEGVLSFSFFTNANVQGGKFTFTGPIIGDPSLVPSSLLSALNGNFAILTPTMQGLGLGGSTPTPQQLYMNKFVLPNDFALVHIGVFLSGALDTNNDPIVVGILDNTGKVVAVSASTTGIMNTAGLGKVPISFSLLANNVYYACFLGTAAAWGFNPVMLWNQVTGTNAAASMGNIFGSAMGTADILHKASVTSFPALNSVVSGASPGSGNPALYLMNI